MSLFNTGNPTTQHGHNQAEFVDENNRTQFGANPYPEGRTDGVNHECNHTPAHVPGGFNDNPRRTDEPTLLHHGEVPLNTAGHGAGHQSGGLPPHNVSQAGGHHSHPGGVTKLVGKVEAAIGSAIGSHSLKEKGLEKQREAELSKTHPTQPTEAERLEGETGHLRERTAGQGALSGNPETAGAGSTFPLLRTL